MRTSIKVFAAATAATALALAGCSSGGGDNGGGDSNDPPRVVAFTSGNQTPIGAWWVKDVEATAEELGWDLTMIQGDFDFQKMNPGLDPRSWTRCRFGYAASARVADVVAA